MFWQGWVLFFLLFRYCLLGYGHLRLSEKNILEGVDVEAVAYAQFYISA